MTKRYIIDKADVHDLLTGKALSLSQGNESAFCVTISGNMTNGDMIRALFPIGNVELRGGLTRCHIADDNNCVCDFLTDWWNAPYREGDAE